jgi:membrane protease YdiL (CAAX protease family)
LKDDMVHDNDSNNQNDIEDYIRHHLSSSSLSMTTRDTDKLVRQVAHVFTCPATQKLMTDHQFHFDRWDLDVETQHGVPCQIMADVVHMETGTELTLTFHWESRAWLCRFFDPVDGKEQWMDPTLYMTEAISQIQDWDATYQHAATERPTNSRQIRRVVQVLLVSSWTLLLFLQPNVKNLSFLSGTSWHRFAQNILVGATFCLTTIANWIRHCPSRFLMLAYGMPWVVQKTVRSPNRHLIKGLTILSNTSRAFHLLGMSVLRVLSILFFTIPATILGHAARYTSTSIRETVEAATFAATPASLLPSHIRSREALPVSSIRPTIPGDFLRNGEGVSLTAVVRAPFLEEFIYRYSIASMFRAASAIVVVVRSGRLLTSRIRLQTPIWGVVSAIVFGLAHMCNHFPTRGSDKDDEAADHEADAQAVGSAITHCTFLVLSSLLVYIPAYQKGGLGASIGAHITWNALVAMEEKGRDALEFLWKRCQTMRTRRCEE